MEVKTIYFIKNRNIQNYFLKTMKKNWIKWKNSYKKFDWNTDNITTLTTEQRNYDSAT